MFSGRIVYNPTAGQFSTTLLVEKAAAVFESNGWNIDLVVSQSGTHTEEIALGAAQDGLKALLVAGGDGSIRQAAAGLKGSNTALGILPAGTSNVWAQDLEMSPLSRRQPNALQEGALALANGRIQSMDYGVCGGDPFLLWAGIGLDGVIVDRRENKRSGRRHFTIQKYLATAALEARTWKGMDLSLDVDGSLIEGHYQLAVINNIPSYAGGLVKISPQACLDDGEMDLWLFSGKNAYQLAYLLLTGKHEKSKLAVRLPFRSLKISAGEPLFSQLDGDPFKYGNHLNIKVISSDLRVLVPRNSPENFFKSPGEML
ncbi:MAG: diacylglycerol kinase family protein [Chloroflexota bacterium]